MDELKGVSKATKEKYDIFVLNYLNTFNATKSAIAAGYSSKSARQQGSTLLAHPYIKGKIKEETARLRDRMRDEGMRSFSMLLNIALDTEEKIEAHNLAEVEIDRLNKEIAELNIEISRENHSINDLERASKAIDGRLSHNKNKKRELMTEIETRNAEVFELTVEISRLISEKRKHEMNYLIPRDWEKLQNLKRTIFQDILDRGGFKAKEEVEISGKMGIAAAAMEIDAFLNRNDSS